MWKFFDDCVDVLVMCVLECAVFYGLYRAFVLFRLYTLILVCFVCTSVRTTANR